MSIGKVAVIAIISSAAISCLPAKEVAVDAGSSAPRSVERVWVPAKSLSEVASQAKDLDKSTHIKLLFALNLKAGKITEVGKGRRELVFSSSDVTSAVGFTDRPQRYAFNMPITALLSIWDAGRDSFSKSPPNAVIEDGRSRIGVTEISGFTIEKSLVKMSLDQMAYRSLDAGDSLDGDLKEIRIFIDSSWLKISGAGVASLLSNAAKACVSVDCELWPLGG
jgi:hypothetical protein